jgi:hypothetical protein
MPMCSRLASRSEGADSAIGRADDFFRSGYTERAAEIRASGVSSPPTPRKRGRRVAYSVEGAGSRRLRGGLWETEFVGLRGGGPLSTAIDRYGSIWIDMDRYEADARGEVRVSSPWTRSPFFPGNSNCSCPRLRERAGFSEAPVATRVTCSCDTGVVMRGTRGGRGPGRTVARPRHTRCSPSASWTWAFDGG